MELIKNGYYIKARAIADSDIAHAPPHFREIWDWILKEASYTDNKVCQKGQCIRSYKDIINGLSWNIGYRKMHYTKSQCENAMKYLVKHTMIATTKTTRGLKITVVNWDKYQNPANYESHTRATMNATREPQQRHTIYNKGIKKEVIHTKGEAKRYLEEWNRVFGKAYVSTTAIEGNLSQWLSSYKEEQILGAIGGIKRDKYWGDKDLTPEWLLRTKENGEPVDRIGRMLNNQIKSSIKQI
jgi:hypothetical protein